MSNTSGGIGGVSGNTIVWAIAAMFIATVGAVVALAIGLPDSQNLAGLASQLLVAFAALVASLGTLFKVSRVEQKVDASAEDTAVVREQTNGGLHRAIREISYESMQKALREHLDEPDLT